MDPDAVLKEIRMLITRGDDCINPFQASEYYEQACVGLNNLDVWLSKGGALPDQWANPHLRRNQRRFSNE